jgi:hypothetical protein
LLFRCRFFSRSPRPPPFSSMNSTPAASPSRPSSFSGAAFGAAPQDLRHSRQ